MKEWQKFFGGKSVRIIDHSDPAVLGTAMASFAVDDTLCESAGRTKDTAACRFWVHDNTVVLGILDSRLPNIAEAVAFLKNEGFDVVVRNSGGLAVVLDRGVLNFSLILPDSGIMGIHSGYELMTAFVREMYVDVTDRIEAFEVTGSYCPGDYDLSIGGKKFAGISQRRVKNGIAVQIYLCIEGNGQARADLVRQFYLKGEAIRDKRFDYPVVEPDTMRSLSDLAGMALTVEDAKVRVLQQFGKWYEQDLTEDELPVFEKRMKQMVDRNEKAFK
ncbi:octanoyl-[GcvH]:protein N-octanoyltransferase [Gracilibacillus ureilyticus]|uniref:Octanoyl-[GcvH]:protein N-octanoyltransferase n=1 Tax=Gracilibacillus ureilyticus TaxID=531814 RepID=A0A1H9SWP5_9BACI|nr:biotin/lipoate A/B protein ligase family protein [Gracilibacillus ureilyticus]SER88793.1 octanoyl-[GcvH]:protein N-octanoyltransferase [Gracilibacillus ureilyticus]